VEELNKSALGALRFDEYALFYRRSLPMRKEQVCKLLQAGVVVCLLSAPGSIVKAEVVDSPTGIKLAVGPDGQYLVTAQDPSWTFGGNLGHPVTNVSVNSGSDGIGAYREITFIYFEVTSRQAGIRVYQNKPAVLFSVSYPEGSINTSPFPVLTTYPQNLYHLTYSDQEFSPYSFSDWGPNSPWLFFDSTANAFIISPASNFMVASMTRGAGGEIVCGINSEIRHLPKGFTHRTLLVIEKGINRAFDSWGLALTDLQGKVRPPNDADVGLECLGYWTDNGATYYYHYISLLGYEGTLLALADYFKREEIPIRYMQIDSWWYPKGADQHWTQGGGIYRYIAHPFIFPQGLKSFQQRLGLPLITHSRWIDQHSPYRSEYLMSNNVSIDPRYWSEVISYIKDAGAITYEQDWLDAQATAANTIEDQEAFMGNMAKACQERGITMQYSMPVPRHYLQGSKYNNLTTIRVTPDRFGRGRWDQFFYNSRLASALGIWPWSDVFLSKELHNLLLATLSAGMVGIGDEINQINKANLLFAVRKDGVIVKPDVAIVPTDETFIRDAQTPGRPMIAFTYSDHGQMRALYVYAYNRGSEVTASFKPACMGMTGIVYVYNFFTGAGKLADAEEIINGSLASGSAYYIIVPVGDSGIAFVGDAGKFVSLSKKRITRLVDNGELEVSVAFATGEQSVTLQGYSPAPVAVRASKGDILQTNYDAAKKRFSIVVSPAPDLTAELKINQQGMDSQQIVYGLLGEYYASANLTNLKLTRIDKTIDFDWKNNPPAPSVAANNFSVRWSGWVVPRYSDTYTFHVSSAGGVRLWVNGKRVVDNWAEHSATEDSGTIELQGGRKYSIKLEYYNKSGAATVSLMWSSSSQAKQVIPKRRLYPADPSPI
jgi:hypothetical protein